MGVCNESTRGINELLDSIEWAKSSPLKPSLGTQAASVVVASCRTQCRHDTMDIFGLTSHFSCKVTRRTPYISAQRQACSQGLLPAYILVAPQPCGVHHSRPKSSECSVCRSQSIAPGRPFSEFEQNWIFLESPTSSSTVLWTDTPPRGLIIVRPWNSFVWLWNTESVRGDRPELADAGSHVPYFCVIPLFSHHSPCRERPTMNWILPQT